MKQILTAEELQTLADRYAAENGSENSESVPDGDCVGQLSPENSEEAIDDDSFNRSEGMITIEYELSKRPAKPYGILASLQERLNSDAARNLRHFVSE